MKAGWYSSVEFWFDDPFAPHQLIAWTRLILSAILLIAGMRLLREIGKPEAARRDDRATIAFEKTTTLVEVGVYKYIRHPFFGPAYQAYIERTKRFVPFLF